MPTLLLSDAHVDAVDDPVQARLVRLLKDPPADRVILVGDVFHRWWDWGDRFFPPYAPTVDALGDLVRRGIPVQWVRGNHDFAVSYLERVLGIPAVDVLDEEIEGVRAYVAHGDGADTSVRVQTARVVLRSAAFAAFVSGLGPERAWSFLGRLAGVAHGVPRPNPDVVRSLRTAARTRLEGNPRLVIFGHSHGLDDAHMAGGRYLNLGAFDHHGGYALLENGRVEMVLGG